MSHTYTNLLTHIIFSTKDRTPFIKPELKDELHAYMGGIIREMKGTAVLINGTADHIHSLVYLPPNLPLSDALRVLKANSSRWVHEEKRIPRFGWQSGYGAFSVSQSNVHAVAAYIARQEEHHRKVTFKEEFVAFLEKNGIVYDEQHLWG